MSKLQLILIFFTALKVINAANILAFFPTPSYSHQSVFHGVMKELASRGHSLTVISTHKIESLLNNSAVRQIDLSSTLKYLSRLSFVKFKENKDNVNRLPLKFFNIFMDFFEKQLKLEEVQEIIKNRGNFKFDAVIFENTAFTPLVALGDIYNCSVISLVSFDPLNQNHAPMNNEANPVLHPDPFFGFREPILTLRERFKVFFYEVLKIIFCETVRNPKLNEISKKYFTNVDVKKLEKQIDLSIYNAHPALGFVRPITPKTIQSGFLHVEPPKEIPDGDLKNFLDSAEYGIVYMSFGTNVNPNEFNVKIKKIFIRVLKNLKLKVVWKFDPENSLEIPSNIFTAKWLPQQDLLAHPKVKFFITQGGHQSMEEAIDRAVPMIVIPFLFDQNANAARVERLKIGLALDYNEINEENFRKSIEEVLKPEYKENIKKLRDIVHDEPMKPREKVAFWIEHVIRHNGTKHFDYPQGSVPFYQKYFIDIIGIMCGVIFMIYKILSMIFMKFFRKVKIE